MMVSVTTHHSSSSSSRPSLLIGTVRQTSLVPPAQLHLRPLKYRTTCPCCLESPRLPFDRQ